MNTIRTLIPAALLAAALLAAPLLPAGLAQAQVTVPNTFGAGTPASSAQVNQNFQALANAVNAVGVPGPAVTSSYRLQPSTLDTLAGRNVVVLRHPGNGSPSSYDQFDSYVVHVAYQSTSDNIPIGGTPKNFAYFFQEIRVTPNINLASSTLTFLSWNISITKRGSDSLTFNPYTAVDMWGIVASSTGLTPTGSSTAYRVTNELGCSSATQVFNQVRFCYSQIESLATGTGVIVVINFDVPIYLQVPAMTIGSIPYSDLAASNNNGGGDCFEPGVRAANLGPVTGRTNCGNNGGGGNAFAVYYRFNGAAAGNLAATAFSSAVPTSTSTAPNNWLYGIWFQ